VYKGVFTAYNAAVSLPESYVPCTCAWRSCFLAAGSVLVLGKSNKSQQKISRQLRGQFGTG
jgi:hypothetical protein